MITIRHISASGTLDSFWALERGAPVIRVRVAVGGAAPIDLTVPVCSAGKPRLGAYVLTRHNEDTWVVSPSLVVFGDAIVPADIESLLPSTSLALTCAPDEVSEMLATL